MKSLSCSLALIVPAMSSLAATPSTESAHRAYVSREHHLLVARSQAEAFVFFEPVGEKLWAEGWRPIFATDADACLHDGTVFTMDYPRPGGNTLHSVWSVTRYDPPRLIEYRNVVVGVRATGIAITCEAAPGDATKVTVRYTYHSLSDDGDEFVRGMSTEKYQAMIAGWSDAIAACLKRGTPATP